MSRVVKIAVVILIVIAATAIWFVNRNETEQITASVAVPVRIEQAKKETLRNELRLTSWIDGSDTVTVLPKVSGTLTELNTEVGRRVSSGEIIGLVDDKPFALVLEQARIAKETAQRELERVTKLYEAGSTGRQTYDQAKAQAESAGVQYEIALLNYENTRITAPVSGRVVAKPANRGALVSPAIPIVTIDTSSEVLVTAQVPERYVRPFVEETIRGVHVSVPSAGIQNLPASIRHIAPYVKSDSRTFEVTCSVGGDQRALFPGMSVRISFILDERRDVMTLPLTALTSDSVLWILDRESMTGHPVKIEPPLVDGDRFEVPSHFFEETEFIVDGQNFLREGVKVRVLGEDVR